MPFSPFDSEIYRPLFNHPAIEEVFSDDHSVKSMLRVEAALASVQGRLGMIPAQAAEHIAEAARTLTPDLAKLRSGTEASGIPVIALVEQLRQHTGPEAGEFVHWGATSQDILDTAFVLQMQTAVGALRDELTHLIRNLAGLADRHRTTLMAGRTHSQQALPITFGLKVAGWLAPLLRHRRRLHELEPRLLVIQMGGAAGTAAAMGDSGLAVQEGLAAELGLAVPAAPWHTQRDNLAEAAGWLSMLNGSLAKMGQDIILLAQSEVGELQESADAQRGGSSTMPQKHNPIVSELIIAAARTNAALLAAMHNAVIQEHERGTHGWQMEWLNMRHMFALTGTALRKAVWLSERISVNEAQMLENVRRANGLMLSEAVTFALSATMGRVEASHLVKEAGLQVREQGRHLIDIVREKTDAPLDWQALRQESAYLGSAQVFIDRVLAEASDG